MCGVELLRSKVHGRVDRDYDLFVHSFIRRAKARKHKPPVRMEYTRGTMADYIIGQGGTMAQPSQTVKCLASPMLTSQ